MRSHAKAPSAGSIWIVATSALAAALLLLAIAAQPAFASIEVAGAEGAAAEKDSATLNGWYVSTDGKEAHYYFKWGETEAYGNTTPLPPGAVAGTEAGFQSVPPVQISGLLGGTTYHYRLVVSDADNIVESGDATFETAPAVTNLATDPATAITNATAELNASFDGDGRETHYYFEWGSSEAYGNTTPAPPGNGVAGGSGRIAVPPVTISGLKQGFTYHYRAVASNALGTTFGPDQSFKAADAPLVENVSSRDLQPTSVELVGQVNPHWGHATYRFEWGPTTAYGNSSPVPDGDAGSGNTAVPVSTRLEGLAPGVTYHFRLVASNPYGSSASPDQTLSFYPPNCPNAQLRQETTSNSLPDCRAYELVTPSFQNGAFVMPKVGQNTGLATSPSRVSYGVAFGIFNEEESPINLYADLFVSTRTDSGWGQKYIGLPANETDKMGGPPINWLVSYTFSVTTTPESQIGTQLSPDLGRAIDYDLGFPSSVDEAGNYADPGTQFGHMSNAPYLWDTTTGGLLERWPTNLAQTPGGDGFVGIPQASPDFSHFVFSSNVVFAAGGEASDKEIRCCPWNNLGWPGPPKDFVYDNDLRSGEVVLASVRKDGSAFQGFVFDVSRDGSHILMSEEPNTVAPPPYNGPGTNKRIEVMGPLYLRVNGDTTYEIAPGHKVRYAGSTSGGSTVYVTSDEQLTPDDHDSSKDLFVWHQSEPNKLTRVSIGDEGQAGDTDSCSAAWTTNCGIGLIEFGSYSKAYAGEGGNGTDNFIAENSGDIYFLSPEQLVDGKGQPGDENLYLYREGTLRFVADMDAKPLCTTNFYGETRCSDTAVARMQITPDGRYMALVTNSHLTGYDSGERGEMFLYDRAAGDVTCVSCRRDGQAPVSEVLASQNGPFLTNDGRPFFSTDDPLVARDTNKAEDVYEYTEGRPWLITSGLAPGLNPEVQHGILGQQLRPGLDGVSLNGTDVYFATYDTLVSQDHNGAILKLYDARTGGGFPAERETTHCSAADECHGPGSLAPELPADRTGTNFGAPAKKKAHKAKKHKKAKHKAKKHKKAKRQKQAAGNGKAKARTANGKQGRA